LFKFIQTSLIPRQLVTQLKKRDVADP